MKFEKAVFSTNSAMENGELTIAGIKATSLTKEFGSPLFVLDENDFRNRAASWKAALVKHFDANAGEVYYAAKSFISVEVAKMVAESGIGIDVCTGGELAVALAANFPTDRMELHGNNKSLAEIEEAIKVGVSRIVIDSIQEIERVQLLAAKAGKNQKVLIRLTPGVEAHTHESISTAHEDVKFGLSIASGAAWKAIEAIEASHNLTLQGFHCHIGSQIFNTEGYEIAIGRIVALLGKFRDHFDRELPEFDMGGGFGIAYLPGEITFDPDAAIAKVASVIKSECTANNLALPKISIEPGRAISGPTTTTLYEVGTTKHIELDGGDMRHYISVDGGMSDNLRTGLYGAKYMAILANRTSSETPIQSRLVGKHCETGDIIIRDLQFPSDVKPGDLIATPATGAYGRSMASNYNHVPRPAVVAVKDGKARLILRRESTKDLLALDVSEVGRELK
jgi:diaminopimelate decarboxylase